MVFPTRRLGYTAGPGLDAAAVRPKIIFRHVTCYIGLVEPFGSATWALRRLRDSWAVQSLASLQEPVASQAAGFCFLVATAACEYHSGLGQAFRKAPCFLGMKYMRDHINERTYQVLAICCTEMPRVSRVQKAFSVVSLWTCFLLRDCCLEGPSTQIYRHWVPHTVHAMVLATCLGNSTFWVTYHPKGGL